MKSTIFPSMALLTASLSRRLLPALHPWLLLLHPHPRPLRLPLPLLLLPHPLLLLPQALLRSRLRCPATSWT